jgi:uncharacterized alkaline shock family protein YloU
MKVFNAFAHVFAIFAFLTLGSLLIIISLHIVTLEDALSQLRLLYTDPWNSTKAGILGLSFIAVGLSFTRMLLKKRRQAEVLIYQSDAGPVVISVTAFEDVVKKVLKRFHLVKESKNKILVQGKDVEIKLRLVLWSGGKIQELLVEIQEDIRTRIRKMIGPEGQVEVTCDVQRIEDHEAASLEPDRDEALSV